MIFGMDIEFNTDVVCKNCGFDMGENYENCGSSEDGVCPECGQDEDDSEAACNMKVKLPEIQPPKNWQKRLTSDETSYLVQMLKQDKENLHGDLSGSDFVDISETAIRLLNDDSNIVNSLLKKLGGGK